MWVVDDGTFAAVVEAGRIAERAERARVLRAAGKSEQHVAAVLAAYDVAYPSWLVTSAAAPVVAAPVVAAPRKAVAKVVQMPARAVAMVAAAACMATGAMTL